MIYKGKVSEKGSRLERNKDELLQLESNFAVILGGGAALDGDWNPERILQRQGGWSFIPSAVR